MEYTISDLREQPYDYVFPLTTFVHGDPRKYDKDCGNNDKFIKNPMGLCITLFCDLLMWYLIITLFLVSMAIFIMLIPIITIIFLAYKIVSYFIRN